MSADGAAPSAGNRIPIAIEEEMKSSFMDYAMSVIVSRALPDARDGLKPVHRRILYAQHGLNNTWNRAYIKCARVVGDVLGKYHPHGDTRRLRRPGAHGPGLLDALHAHRRPGQLRLGRRRSAGGLALHRVPDGEDRRRAAGRHRQGDRRLPAELRRQGDASRRSCRRASRTCWSTAPPASRSAWRPTSRRTTCARSSTRRSR